MDVIEPGVICAVALIVSPLLAALVSFLWTRAAAPATFVNGVVTILAALMLLDAVAERPFTIALGGWAAPLGIALAADALGATLALTTAVVVTAVVVYAPSYLSRAGTHAAFWPLLCFLQAGLGGLYLSADIFNLYVALELIGLAAVALIALGGHASALVAALRYLMANVTASLAYLLGVALLYHAHGALDLALLADAMRGGDTPWAALGLMTAGLAVKGALFPVHFWLPEAHAEAPAPVSALLSALVVKAPFFVLLRLGHGPFETAPAAVGQVLGLLGAVAILWGSVQALRQDRLKLLVAYSTVAQVGYLFLYFPLSRSGDVLGAVTVFIVAHALAKAALFLAAGNLLEALGHDRIQALDRVAGRMPLSLAAFGIAGLCIAGLPPSGNFVAKWLLIEAALESGAWGWAVVIVLGGLLSAAYVFRVVGHAFTPEEGAPSAGRVTAPMAWMPFILALLALVIGFVGASIVPLVGSHMPATGATAVLAP